MVYCSENRLCCCEAVEGKMQFELTEEQAMIQETARRFAAEEIAPTLVEEEKKHE